MTGYASIQRSTTIRPDTSYFLKTTDGGRTWQEHVFLTDKYYKLQGIGFINDSTGWIGGDDVRAESYKTTDGGINWQTDSSFAAPQPPYNLYRGNSVNRFRRFGDSLMYASGKTIYRFGNAPVLEVKIQKTGRIAAALYPNPFSDQVELLLTPYPAGCKAFLNIYNMLGQQVQKNLPLKEGVNRFSIRRLTPGNYMFRISVNGVDVASRLMTAE
jgi:hypothetical protein